MQTEDPSKTLKCTDGCDSKCLQGWTHIYSEVVMSGHIHPLDVPGSDPNFSTEKSPTHGPVDYNMDVYPGCNKAV